MIVLDKFVEESIKAERRARGIDRYDEVWDGLYIIGPVADNEHQDVQTGLCCAIQDAYGLDSEVRISAGANVSDLVENWEHNYRWPDAVVVCPGSIARDCDSHWHGGPDFVAEIVSKGDRSRDKLNFYARIGVRELLVIDRYPWQLELYRLTNGALELVCRSNVAESVSLRSAVVPASFRLLPGTPRPKIEVIHHNGRQHSNL